MREILITSSVLIVIIALLRTLLKGKISLRLQYALWLLVALRLLVPVSLVQSPVSVMNMVATVERVAQQTVLPKAPQTPGIMEPSTEGNANTGTNFVVPAAPSGQTAPAGPKAPANAAEIAKMVWLAGVGGMALWFLVSDFLFRRKLRRSAGRLEGIKCGLPVYVSEAVPSPCLYGALRPAIYLTLDCLENENTLRHVLAHEETHYRHADQIWAMVRCVCLAVYWFNPLVWLAAALSRRDCELACDEGAILRLGEVERLSYGRTLLSMVVPKRVPGDLLCTATTMTSGKNGLRERIALIAKRPKAALVTVVAVVLIAAVAVGCTFTGAQVGETPAPDVPIEEALTALPEELKDSVVLTAKEDLEEDTLLEAFYKEDYGTQWGGALLLVWRVTPVVFEKNYAFNTGGVEPLARDADWYYVLYAHSPDEVKDSPEHEAGYHAAQQAAVAWVKDIFANQSGLTAMEDDPSYQAINAEVSYPGRHVDVSYKPNYGLEYYPEGQKDETYKLLLSQPVRQGEGGIWCVDHWYYREGQYLPYIPDAQVPIAEYYAMLQESADKGEETWRLDPLRVSMDFVEYMFEVEGRPVEAFTVGGVYEGEPPLEGTAGSVDGEYESLHIAELGATLLLPASWAENYTVEKQDERTYWLTQKDFLAGEWGIREDGTEGPIPNPEGHNVVLTRIIVQDKTDYQGPGVGVFLGEKDGLVYVLAFQTSFSAGDSVNAEEKAELYNKLTADIEMYPVDASAYFIFD